MTGSFSIATLNKKWIMVASVIGPTPRLSTREAAEQPMNTKLDQILTLDELAEYLQNSKSTLTKPGKHP